YLIIVVALLTAMALLPLATIESHETLTSTVVELQVKPFMIGEGAQNTLTAVSGSIYFSVILSISLLITLTTIFFYKNRMFQVRMCFTNMAMLLGLQVFTGYSLYRSVAFVEQMNRAITNFSPGISYSVVDVFPAVSIIFTYLAFRGIMKDEMLIKSLNRIR
ncbi:MAG: DUF4293 domain-containing protein, partial [Rikenellaceae bacterium]